MASGGEDGKVIFKYEGDTSGIDTANKEAEAKLKSGGESLETSAKETAGKVSDAAKSAGDSVQNASSKTKSSVSNHMDAIKTAAGMTFTAAGAAALAFGKRGIELASDLTEVQNVVDTVFGANASKINTFAQNAGKSFGLSELSAKQYTSTLGAMLKSMGLSSDATMDMSEKMTGLAGDFASFYNLDPADAFEKIRSGISGETEPLKELGINMDQTNLQTFALSQGIKTQVQDMTQAQLATLRYNYLLSVSKDAQGDYAKTSNSVANEQRTVGTQFDQISAKVGSALLPVLNKLLTLLLQVLSPILSFVQAHPKVTAGIMAVMVALGVLGGTLTFTSSILPVLNALLGTTALTAGAAGAAAGGAAIGFGALLLPLLAIIVIVAAVIAVVVLVATHWKQLGQIAQTVGNAIKGAFLGALDGIKSAWNGVTGFFAGIWDGLKSGATAAGNGIKKTVSDVRDGIASGSKSTASGIQSAFSSVIGFFYSIGNGIKEAFNNAFHALTDAFSAFRESWENGFGIMQTPLETFFAVVAAIGREIFDFFHNIFTGIESAIAGPINSIVSAANKVVAGVKQVFSGFTTLLKDILVGPWLLVIDLISVLWTHSFTKLNQDATKLLTQMSTAVHTILQGFYNIFVGIFNMLKSYVILVVTAIVAVPTSIFRAGVALFKEIWMDFSDQLKATWNGIKAAATTTFNSLLNFFKSVGSAIVAAWNSVIAFFTGLPGTFTSIMNSIGNGIRSVWENTISFFASLPGRIGGIMNSAGSWVRSVWDGIVSFLASIPGRVGSALSGIGNAIHGAFDSAIGFVTGLPGEALQWGKDIIDGIVNGIKSAASAVGDAVQGVAQDIRSFLHFSQPDKGPLREFPEWPRDMMQTWADELSGNDTIVLSAVKKVTGNMADSVQTGTGASIARAVSASTTSASIAKGATTIDNSVTKAPVQNFYGPVNLADKGSAAATLQQTQFVAPM